MNEPETNGEKKKIRVKTRVPGGRAKKGNPGISRRKIATSLILAAAVGIFFGLLLGRGIKKIIRIHREQNDITQSLSGSDSGIPESEPAGLAGGPGESPGR
jgi:hypothetical protein